MYLLYLFIHHLMSLYIMNCKLTTHRIFRIHFKLPLNRIIYLMKSSIHNFNLYSLYYISGISFVSLQLSLCTQRIQVLLAGWMLETNAYEWCDIWFGP